MSGRKFAVVYFTSPVQYELRNIRKLPYNKPNVFFLNRNDFNILKSGAVHRVVDGAVINSVQVVLIRSASVQ